MKPAMFEYDDPTTLDETIELLARHGDECKVLAGGQSLVPLMNFRLARPARVIDINGVQELAGIRREQGRVVIGAMTRHSDVEGSNLVAEGWPLLHEAIGWVARARTCSRPRSRARSTAGCASRRSSFRSRGWNRPSCTRCSRSSRRRMA